MPPYKYLTDAEARAMTRSQLLDRVSEQQAYYEAKRRKTAADEAAMDELSRIIHRYLNINSGFDAAFATLGGYTGPSYWDTRPAHDEAQEPASGRGPTPAPASWPSSAASPQEQTAALFARLTPQRLAQLYAEEDDDE